MESDSSSDIEYDENGYPLWKNSRKYCHFKSIMKKHDLKEIPNGCQVHHLDGDKKNFTQRNLILLKKQDHEDLERYLRQIKNLNIAYFVLIGLAFPYYLISFMRIFGEFMSMVYFVIATILLFLAFILRVVPAHIIRKSLFKLRILKANKRE